MLPPRQVLFSLDLPCDSRAPATARAALTEVHDGTWALQDAQMIASELVTNAVLHSGASEDHTLTIEGSCSEDALIISVNDPGLSGEDARRAADGRETGGWGLMIVESLARRWGTDSGRGYCVWAELGRADASPVTDEPLDRCA